MSKVLVCLLSVALLYGPDHSARLDGATGYLVAPQTRLDLTQARTWEGWFRPAPAAPGTYQSALSTPILPIGKACRNGTLDLNISQAADPQAFILNVSIYAGSTYTLLTDISHPHPYGPWYHLAVTLDDSQTPAVATLFLDGHGIISSPLGGAWCDGHGGIFLGVKSINGTMDPLSWYHGDISEVRISSVVRYTADFTPDPAPVPDADTLARWPLLGDAQDASRRGNDGTAVGGVTWVLPPMRSQHHGAP